MPPLLYPAGAGDPRNQCHQEGTEEGTASTNADSPKAIKGGLRHFITTPYIQEYPVSF